MTTDQLPYYFEKYNLAMAEPHPYKLPILRKYDSLDKPWYVEYYVYSQANAKLKRKRIVLAEPTASARLEHSRAAIKQISELLKKGAIVDPLRPNKVLSLGVNANTEVLHAIDQFLEIHKKTTKPNTYDSYKLDLKRFQKFIIRHNLHRISLSNFTEPLAYRCMDELIMVEKLGNRTRNNVRATLITFFNYYTKRKILTSNPFQEIQKLRAPAKKHTAIANFHVKEILDEIKASGEHQLLLFVLFEYYAAIRPNTELRLLKVSEILDKTICINADDAKDAIKTHIQIPPPLEKKIQEYSIRSYPKDYYVFSKNGEPGPKPNGKKYQYIRHRAILKKLNLDHLNYDVYSWKHTGAIALFLEIQDIEVCRQHLRHKNIQTTLKYYRDLGQFVDSTKIDRFPDIS